VLPVEASFVDLAFALMQSPSRGYDFGFSLEFSPGCAPSLEALQRGATRALERFPKSQSLLLGRSWVHAGQLLPPLRERSCGTSQEASAAVSELLSVSFDLTRELGLRQLLVHDLSTGTSRLVSQVHHALGDVVSLIAWLHCQLVPDENLAPAPPLILKRHPRAQRKSRFAFSKPCQPIRPTVEGPPSARRAWRTVFLADQAVKDAVHRRAGFSYNDLLAAIGLATVQAWNQTDRIGLWLPINIRERPFEGFGNGASRIRIYDRSGPGQSFLERALAVREQVRWSKEHGEWHAPDLTGPLRRWPTWLLRGLLRAFANRPGVDYCSTTFSHAEKLGAMDDAALLPGVARVEAMPNIHGTHTLAFAAIGFGGQTSLTFAWDPARYADSDVDAFIAVFRDHQGRAFAEVLADA
jgi:hypothetical protein